MLTIYSRYRAESTSFVNTLRLLQDLLNERLVPEYSRIWVQGTNSGKGKLCFTIFNGKGYTMRFFESGGLRQFRSDGNLEEEVRLIEDLINRLRNKVLQGVI